MPARSRSPRCPIKSANSFSPPVILAALALIVSEGPVDADEAPLKKLKIRPKPEP
jgi:hypothetical protein